MQLEFIEYLESLEINDLLYQRRGETAKVCICRMCRLIWNEIPEIGKQQLKLNEKMIAGDLGIFAKGPSDSRVWEECRKYSEDSKAYMALRAVVCSIWHNLPTHEIFEAITIAADYIQYVCPEVSDEALIDIFNQEFKETGLNA